MVGAGVAVGFGSMLGMTAASYTAATTGFINGAMVGMAEGAASGFILNTGNSLIEGANFGESMKSGMWGAVSGGITGGIYRVVSRVVCKLMPKAVTSGQEQNRIPTDTIHCILGMTIRVT